MVQSPGMGITRKLRGLFRLPDIRPEDVALWIALALAGALLLERVGARLDRLELVAGQRVGLGAVDLELFDEGEGLLRAAGEAGCIGEGERRDGRQDVRVGHCLCCCLKRWIERQDTKTAKSSAPVRGSKR